MLQMNYEELFKESTNTLKTLFNLIEDYMFLVDESGCIIQANDAALRALGYRREELCGESILTLYPPKRHEEAFAAAQAMMEGKIYKSTIPLFSKSKEYIFVETRLFRSRWEGKNIAIGICKDISALKNHEKYAEMLLNTVPSAVFSVDRHRKIVSWNKWAEKLTGYTEEEVVGKHCNLFSDMPCRDQCTVYSENTQKPVEGKICTLKTKEGKLAYISKNVDILRDENGEIIGGIECLQDITERIQMEDQLRESEERYSAIVNNAPEIVLIHKMGKFLFINDSGLKTLGYKKSEIISHNINEFVSEQSKERILSAMKRRIRGEAVEGYEVEFYLKSGEIRNLMVKTSSITYEDEPAVLAVLIDITERKRVEEALNRKEKILSAVAMSIKEFLDNKDYMDAVKKSFELLGAATQVDRVYLFQNTYDDAGMGYTSKKIEWISDMEKLPMNPSRMKGVLFEDAFSFLEPLMKEEAYCGIVREIENDRTRKILEEQQILSIAVIPIFVGTCFWGFVGFDDCTWERVWSQAEFSALKAFTNSLERAIERSIFNEELEKSKKTAETASILKSQFLANMSHEIRTPMNGIVGFLDLLLQTNMTEEQLDFLTQVKSASSALLVLINDILDYSKIEANRLELEKILFDVHALVKESAALFMPKAYEQQIQLRVWISENVPEMIYGDPGRLKQVLNNLIGNALKFTEKGEVAIELSLLEEKEDQVKIQFKVRDTGIGMKEDVLARLFTVFTQADPSTTRKYGGTGLGLAISKRIITLMGGEHKSRKYLGKGFYFLYTSRF